MNHIAPGPNRSSGKSPLSRLALAPENVRKTPPDQQADAELKASIAALGLLENLVVRTDEPDGELPGIPLLARLRPAAAGLGPAAGREHAGAPAHVG